MNRIDYEGSVIPGGIEAFDGVINLKKSETEVGESPVPSPDAARTYARFVESIIDAQQAAEEDDGQPLAVVTGRDGITRVRRPRQRQSAPNVLTLKVENDVGGPTSLPLPA